jgi:hypothetical protein
MTNPALAHHLPVRLDEGKARPGDWLDQQMRFGQTFECRPHIVFADPARPLAHALDDRFDRQLPVSLTPHERRQSLQVLVCRCFRPLGMKAVPDQNLRKRRANAKHSCHDQVLA